MSNINYSNSIDNLKARYNPDHTQLFESRVFNETSGLIGNKQKYVIFQPL